MHPVSPSKERIKEGGFEFKNFSGGLTVYTSTGGHRRKFDLSAYVILQLLYNNYPLNKFLSSEKRPGPVKNNTMNIPRKSNDISFVPKSSAT